MSSKKTNNKYQVISNTSANKLLKIKKTQLKMMDKRGYDISTEKALLQYDTHNFTSHYSPIAYKNNKSFRSTLSQIYYDKQSNICAVYYADVPSNTTLGKDNLCEFINFLDECNTKNGILITAKPLSPDAKKNIIKLRAYNIQVFADIQLITDPTEHIFVPKHELLTSYEANQLLSLGQLKTDQMPLFSPKDPIVRFLGGKAGQIVRVYRHNLIDPLTRVSIIYRYISETNKNNKVTAPDDNDFI